jgi:hypothetical protein
MRAVRPRLTPLLAHTCARPLFVILVLGTRIHEFACNMSSCTMKLVDGRAKHDHDDKRGAVEEPNAKRVWCRQPCFSSRAA